MLMLVSQDGLKAIDAKKIDFYYILSGGNSRGNYPLYVKTPKSPVEDGEGFDLLLLFEHEDIAVVKAVMEFLIEYQFICPDNCILHVNLNELCNYGMKVAPELLETDFKQRKNSAE